MPRAVVENRLDDPQPVRDRETALSQLMAMSPELRAAHAEVHRARSMISRERAQPIPNVEFQVAALHNAATGDEVANVQVGLPLPLNNRNDGNICRAHAEYQRALWNVERLKLDLQSRLAAAFGQYNAALNQVRIYENEILPRESETLRLIEAAYPIQFDFLRVITARRSYFEAQLEYVTALVNLRQAEVALDGLLLEGGLSGVDDTEIDDSGRSNALSGQ